ncbi:unnamed protein product [Pedinophyceae sp. YPF-701]|nr:unnamed protein product [Pedinophyceae sp. YPF-701]
MSQLESGLQHVCPAALYDPLAGLAVALLAAVWACGVARRLPAGLVRFAAVLPCVVAFTLVTGCMNHRPAIVVMSAGFLWLWLANFKVLALALDRGPLAIRSLTFLQFVFSTVLPVHPLMLKRAKVSSHEGPVSLLWILISITTKLPALWAFVHMLQFYDLPWLAQDVLWALCLYLFLGPLLDIPGSVALGLLNLECESHMKNPFRTTSFTNYWQRWNLVAGSSLRHLIYDPLVEGRLVRHRPPEIGVRNSAGLAAHLHARGASGEVRRAAGMVAAFLASAGIHELIIWLGTRSFSYQYRWFWFFAIQGPIVIAERCVASLWARAGLKPLPEAVMAPAALTALFLVGSALFIEPCVKMGIAQGVLNETHRLLLPAERLLEPYLGGPVRALSGPLLSRLPRGGHHF